MPVSKSFKIGALIGTTILSALFSFLGMFMVVFLFAVLNIGSNWDANTIFGLAYTISFIFSWLVIFGGLYGKEKDKQDLIDAVKGS